eukprot:6466347-Amphidinium_carterae.1
MKSLDFSTLERLIVPTFVGLLGYTQGSPTKLDWLADRIDTGWVDWLGVPPQGINCGWVDWTGVGWVDWVAPRRGLTGLTLVRENVVSKPRKANPEYDEEKAIDNISSTGRVDWVDVKYVDSTCYMVNIYS